MSDDQRADRQTGGASKDDSNSPQDGVLGNLPRTRPAVRSPRRRQSRPEPAERSGDEATARAQSTGEAPGADSPDDPSAAEALARGGLSVAGEAASLGLRLAGRAAAAVRDAVERR